MGGNGGFVRVLVVGAAVSGLVGCGGAGPPGQILAAATPAATAEVAVEASAEPSVSASPRPTLAVTAVSEPGALPAAARKHTPKGAEAFVRYWVAVANAALASGDTSGWRELNAESCQTCSARIADLEEKHASGGRIEGGQLEILSIVATPLEPNTIPQVIVDVAISAERSFDGSGQLLRGDRGGQSTYSFLMVWNKPGWAVGALKRLVPE